MGAVAGLILGISLAALTRAYFFSAPDSAAHRKVAGWAGVLAPVPLLPLTWALYGLDPTVLVVFGVVPVLVLSVVGWFVGRGVAGWYSGEGMRWRFLIGWGLLCVLGFCLLVVVAGVGVAVVVASGPDAHGGSHPVAGPSSVGALTYAGETRG